MALHKRVSHYGSQRDLPPDNLSSRMYPYPPPGDAPITSVGLALRTITNI